MWLFFVNNMIFEQAIASRLLVVNDSYLECITNKLQSSKASFFPLPNKRPVNITFSDNPNFFIKFSVSLLKP